MTAPPEGSVRALAYIGVVVEDPPAWLRFASGALGFMPAAEADGKDRLRIDARAWRIAVAQGAANDLDFMGFEVSDDTELAAIERKLAALGHAVTADDGALARDRGVSRMIHCVDPLGIRIEIVSGATDRFEQPFVSPCGVSGFVTGDQGLGHVVLGSDDLPAMRRFYVDGLGFRLSDRIRMPIGSIGQTELEFYHCNPRPHTLALVPARRPRRLFHFMVQVADIDDVGFALDRVLASGAKLTATLGRHTNDHMVSFYAATPGGIEVEYGCGARTIDDTVWRVALHHKPSMWGHKRG
jgi:biphenyl-2,3-diol 1,2-dioxygenase